MEKIPENFQSILRDFSIDLSLTFPEYSYLWAKWTSPDIEECDVRDAVQHCLSVYPARFFDILYQNSDIFKPEDTTETYFLPSVDFKLLFNCADVSENTKKTIWKYLQLILFSVIGGVKDKSNFGDTLNMFEGINEAELNQKMQETMAGLSDFFKSANAGEQPPSSEKESSSSGENEKMPDLKSMFEGMGDFKKSFNMPDMENIQDHLKSLFDGKIGKLAKEMADEISEEFGDLLGAGDMNSTDDVLKNLMKDPKKIMNLMKTVGGKLDTKLKSGEISKEEIMKEAGDFIGKMKDMGGAQQFQEMFKNLSKGMGLGKNVRLDENAMNRMTKQQSTRERLLRKMEQKRQLKEEEIKKLVSSANFSLQQTQEPNNFVFRLPDEEAQEKSYIDPMTNPEFMADLMKGDAPVVATDKKKKKKKSKK